MAFGPLGCRPEQNEGTAGSKARDSLTNQHLVLDPYWLNFRPFLQ
jgi:hypothetical protein